LKHKFACSPGDVRKARQMLRNIEEKHQFLGAPLDQRRKGRVSS
jgi:tetrahydromethanopterin S-methyltransferase subunit G